METQLGPSTQVDSAHEKRKAKVPVARPSPAHGTTPTSTGTPPARSDAVLSPISADLPVGKTTVTTGSKIASLEAAGDGSKENGGDRCSVEVTGNQPKIREPEDKMAAIRPGFPSYPVSHGSFCSPYMPAVSTSAQTILASNGLCVSSSPLKCGPISPNSGAVRVGPDQSTVKRISPTLRVVSPNSVPVKKRSAFRAETDSSQVDRCVQKESGVVSQTLLQVDTSRKTDICKNVESYKLPSPEANQQNSSRQSKDEQNSTTYGNENKVDQRLRTDTDVTPTDYSSYKTTSNVLHAADDIDLTPSAKGSKLVQEEGATGLTHTDNKNFTSGQVKQDSREGERTDASGNNLEKRVVWSPTNIKSHIGKEEIKTTGNVDTRQNLVTTGVSDRKETSPVYLTNEASKVGPLKGTETAGGKTNTASNNSTDSSPKSLAGQLHGGTAQSSPSCYPPLYLTSNCQVTLGRESNKVHKDGSKVHATTFVPDLGEFIPGPASSTREPPSRGSKNGQPSGDNQMVKISDSSTLKGNVQNSFKNGISKEKKGSRHAGHAEHSPTKVPKKEGKRSPSGGFDRTMGKVISQSSGIKMAEASFKSDKRTESYAGIDVTRKLRDVGHVATAKSPSATKVSDLSVVTQYPYGYQPLLSVGGSPPGQKTLSPRDRKSSEFRGTGSEMTDKQRQMIEWQMAAASQHGIFYEPHHPMWSPSGFSATRTAMITSHSSTVSTQESVLRSALLHGGQKHHGTNSHTTTSMTSPKMTVAEAPHKVEPSDIPRPKREEPKKSHTGKMNFAEIGSGRGTPNSKSGDSTPTRNPPVGIALVQQRQETERKTDSRGSTGSSHRDRSDERRHRDSSRTTFSPITHRDSRGSDSHREHRSSSNPSQPSLVSHHNPNLTVTGGSSVGSHAQEYLAHHTSFPPFPPCYPRFPAGHASPSQPLWLPQPYTMPAAAHGSSSLSSTYQDVPLPGNMGLEGREGIPGHHVMMLPPHLSTADGALHGLGAWPSPYLLPSALHPQLSSLNPSLYAQFAHLPQGGSSMAQPLHILSGQSESHPQMGSELHAILQQQEVLFHWYRAAELHSRHSPFSAMSHGEPIHASSQQQVSDHGRKSSSGRKSAESKSDVDKKQLKSETRDQESCGRTSREVVEDKVTHSAPPIMPAFPPVIPGPAMSLFYPPHPLPYLLDPTKSHIVPPHSSSPTTKVEKKDAGTSSHSPAGRPASRDRQKFTEVEVKGSDSSLKTACVQTLPPDNISENKKDDETKIKEDEKETEKVDPETSVGETVVEEDVKVDVEIAHQETEDVHVEVEKTSHDPKPEEKVEGDSEQSSKIEQPDSQVPPEKENLSEKSSQESSEITEDTVDRISGQGNPPTTCDSGSETWLTNYSSCLDGQRRESLITSVMTTTQSVASKIDSMDQEQLAAIEGIALLSEAAEQKTFEAICKRKDEISEAPVESDRTVRSQGQSSTIEKHETDISSLQPPQDLSVSINTEEMKINKLVELQRKFKEKKKEFDKLQRKKERKERVDKSSEETKKRGPGRPRKRKNSQRGNKNENPPSEKREPQSNTLQSSADVLLEAAASLEEPIIPAKKKKKEKKEKKSKTKKEPVEDTIREDMSTSSLQSSADVLLEAAASLEQPPPPISGKKKKKEKRDKKTKSKRESVGDVTPKEGKDSRKKKKKPSKKKDAEDIRDLQSEGKVKKKIKHSLSSSEVSWPSSSLSSLTSSSLTKKKATTKSGEKKRKSSKIKTGLLPALPQTIDELPAPVGASLPMYGEQKSKSKQPKGGLSISHVYGDSSDSDDEGSSQSSFPMVPKGLALLASTAELSSGHSTPVKKPVKKEKVLTKKQSKSKTEEKGIKKRPLTDDAAASVKKLKLSKKKDKLKLQKSLKKEKKATKKINQKQSTETAQAAGLTMPPTPKFDAESWSRRRSERIFLNDTSPQQSRDVSPLSKPSEGGKVKIKLSMGSPNKLKVEKPIVSPGLSNIGTVLAALKTDPFQMRKKFSKMSESDNDKDEEGVSESESQDSKNKLKLKSKTSRDKLSILYNEIDADSDSSDSEAEDMPLSSLVDKPTDPAPRMCNLRKDDLNEGQRVLVPLDNLFYEGKIHPIRPPDVYGVILDRRRGNRPHVYSQEQILQEVIADVKPNSIKYLPEGTRICAYWSQQYNCLYPGTVVKGSPNPSGDKKLVTVEFDDGDSGRIPLSHVRMLPQDYPVISDLGISSIPLERRLRQKNTETSCNLDEMKDEDDDDDLDERIRNSGSFKTGGKMRKNKQLPKEGDDEVFLPNNTPVVKSPRGRKPKVKPPAKRATALQSAPSALTAQGGPVKKGRGRPRKIRPEDQVVGQPPKKGRPRKKPLSGSVTIAKKINKFYAGRKKATQSKLTKPTTTGARPRGRPPGSKKGKKAKSQSCTVETVFSSEILDPAQAAMLRYNGPDDSEDAGTIGESDIWSQEEEEEEVAPKKGKGSKNSKIAAFLPERQLWRWLGNATQRKGSKGKAKKVFYKAIVRGKEVIRVNECAVFLSTGRPHLPYVGRIESMWESWGGIMVVRVKWFYHPEETKGCAANHEGKMALYQSSHVDENDIQTISHKCEVIPREEYKLRAMGKIPKNSVIDNDDVYYLAGTYDPTTGRMATFQ